METLNNKEVIIETIMEEAKNREEEMYKNSSEVAISNQEIRKMFKSYLIENPEAKTAIESARSDIASIQLGLSDKVLFIGGPCAASSELLANNLSNTFQVGQELHSNSELYPNIVNLVRAPWQKPRSGPGFAGLYNERGGIEFALDNIYLPFVKNKISFSSELLNPDDPLQYIASSMWIGARTIGNSSLRYATSTNPTCPTGLKNGENGSLKLVNNAANTIKAKTHISMLDSNDNLINTQTAGNDFLHVIYRGGGLSHKDFLDHQDTKTAFQNNLLQTSKEAYLIGMRTIVDISHANALLLNEGNRNNSQGQLNCFDALEELIYKNPVIFKAGENNIIEDIHFNKAFMGIMTEVDLEEGRGPYELDPCISVEDAKNIQERLSMAVKEAA